MKNIIIKAMSIITLCLLVYSSINIIKSYNALLKSKHIVNIYVDGSKYNFQYFDNTKNLENKNTYSYVPWRQSDNEQILNEDLNRNTEATVFYLYDDSSFLLEGTILFRDNTNGCIIDEDTAYKLFGSIDVTNRNLIINNRNLKIIAVNNNYKNTVFVQDTCDSTESINGISLEIPSDDTVLNLDDYLNSFFMKYGLKNSTVDSNIYIDISAFFILIYLTIIIVHIIYYTCKKNIEFKNKPILRSIYTLLGITLILILTSIFNIKIPINLIPNKWSNFEQVIEIYKKYIFQFQYFFYSKKYCIDIIRIRATTSVIIYTFISGILFIICSDILSKKLKMIKM